MPPIDQSWRSPGAAVLVSGASFAGLAMAYWLNRLGYRVTVVEVARGLRRGGTPVDLEGEAIDVLARMGLIDAVRAKALPPRSLEFKNADDTTVGVFGDRPDTDDATAGRYEVHRDDLLDVLFAAVRPSTEVVFGRSIHRLEDGPDDVVVTFSDGSRRRFALVFGCDGNRSNTRRLAFAEVTEPSYFMGAYFAIEVVPITGLVPANRSQIFSVPGRTAMLNGYNDRTDIVLAFRSGRVIDYDYRDRAHQRRMIHDHFDGLGWKVPAMLGHLDLGAHFYFDKVNQIRMPAWSTGRVALVGDAGYCVSPVAGMGGSMSIIGAGRMGDALARHGVDHAAAFNRYHDDLRAFVEDVQERAVVNGMAMMFPADDAELAERDRKLGEGVVNL